MRTSRVFAETVTYHFSHLLDATFIIAYFGRLHTFFIVGTVWCGCQIVGLDTVYYFILQHTIIIIINFYRKFKALACKS